MHGHYHHDVLPHIVLQGVTMVHAVALIVMDCLKPAGQTLHVAPHAPLAGSGSFATVFLARQLASVPAISNPPQDGIASSLTAAGGAVSASGAFSSAGSKRVVVKKLDRVKANAAEVR
jgi:hypothetical protein